SSRRDARRPTSRGGCGCRRRRPSGSSKTCSAATPSGCGAPSGCSRGSSSTRAGAPCSRAIATRSRKWTRTRSWRGRSGRSRAELGLRGEELRRAGLLASPGVAVKRAALDGLVDRRDELAVGLRGVALVALDGGGQAAEVGLDRRGVAAVLEPLALGAQDPLLLGCDVGHGRAAWSRGPRGAVL